MSFFINNNNQCRPGPINNNTQSVCEKMLIEVKRVFDACLSTVTEQGILLTITNLNPPNPTFPLTYISTESNPAKDPIISNLMITRLELRPEFATITAQVEIPLIVTYRDANGVIGTAESSFTTTISTVLFVPQPALTPVDIKIDARLASSIGTFTSDLTCSITACLQIVVKVVAEVDILIPTYGYPYIPLCQSALNVCPGLSDVPLYPSLRTPNTTFVDANNLR